jgi:hypothetical protein
MHFSNQEIVAMMAGASFAAGLNVYATVATLGLLGRFQVLQLPPHLHIVESWPVIGVALVMFVVEFFADKIPAFDLIWNALHTFIRVPIAALMAYAATAQLSPQAQILSAVAASAIAFASHGGKMAVRAAVTPSPEPLSNAALSVGEDVAAVGLTWIATTHPYIAAGITLVLLIVTFLAVRLVLRALKRLFRGASRRWQQLQTPPRAA